MPTRVNVDIGGAVEKLEAAQEKFERLKAAIIRWAQVGMQRFILPRLVADTPRRTGRLQAARQFRKVRGGGQFFWDQSGFYWRFQPGLPERQTEIVREALPRLIEWAIANARREVGI